MEITGRIYTVSANTQFTATIFVMPAGRRDVWPRKRNLPWWIFHLLRPAKHSIIPPPPPPRQGATDRGPCVRLLIENEKSRSGQREFNQTIYNRPTQDSHPWDCDQACAIASLVIANRLCNRVEFFILFDLV